MREIGLLSLTRFGDLIQTSPITRGLRRRHPDARIHLIVKSRFRRVASLLPGVDVVHEIDGDALARALSEPTTPFSEPYGRVSEIVERLGRIHFDLLINFTHSRSSAVLLSLLNARRSVGFTLDREGQRRVDDAWLIHMGTLVRARRLFRLNLVDVYLGAAGLLGCGERLRVDIAPPARQLAESLLVGRGPFVAVQLGASQDAKTWSVAHYARTLDALRARIPGLTAVVVGVTAEAERADALRAACPELRIKRLVGETSIEELGAVLERCQLLLTGDTGTMHLAAAVGTRVCAVFVGLGNPYETAPYGEGHLTLRSRIACAPCSHLVRCGHTACHEDVPPDWLADVMARVLDGRRLEDVPALPRADLLRTGFDANGMLELVPLHARAPDPHDLLALAYHRIFLEDLAGIPADLDAVRDLARRDHGVEPEAWADLLPEGLSERLAELERLARRAVELTERLPTMALARVRDVGRELAALDAALYAIGRSEPLVAPLCLSLEGEAESLPDGELPRVARASRDNYLRLARRAGQLLDLLEPSRTAKQIPAHEPAATGREGRS